jgi:hypothetical protein
MGEVSEVKVRVSDGAGVGFGVGFGVAFGVGLGVGAVVGSGVVISGLEVGTAVGVSVAGAPSGEMPGDEVVSPRFGDALDAVGWAFGDPHAARPTSATSTSAAIVTCGREVIGDRLPGLVIVSPFRLARTACDVGR